MDSIKYSADITAGSLLIPESRVVAALLLDGVSDADWQGEIVSGNALQKKSPATAIRQARLIKKRLQTMDSGLWTMVRDATSLVATQAVFAAAIKHSRLLGDFLDLVVREQFRIFDLRLHQRLWDEYLEGCSRRDESVHSWTKSTSDKTGQNVYRILREAGYLIDTKSLQLQRVIIAAEVLDYLRSHEERYVLRCIEVSHG